MGTSRIFTGTTGQMTMLKQKPTTTITRARGLAHTGMARSIRQAIRMGPKVLWQASHRSRRGDDLAKQPAAMSTKGVVGINGTIAAIAPKVRAANPALAKKSRRTSMVRSSSFGNFDCRWVLSMGAPRVTSVTDAAV